MGKIFVIKKVVVSGGVNFNYWCGVFKYCNVKCVVIEIKY